MATYTSQKPDALFAGGYKDYPATTSGAIGADVTGELVRGTALKRTAAGVYVPVVAADTAVHAILAADVTATTGAKIAVYQKGQYNKNAVIFPATKTSADFALGSAQYGIYFENSVGA